MMKTAPRLGRRRFLTGMARFRRRSSRPPSPAPPLHRSRRGQAPAPPRIKFAVIGINHLHIYSQVAGGAARRRRTRVVVCRASLTLPDAFLSGVSTGESAHGPRAKSSTTASIQLVLSSAHPDQRVPLGIRVMQRGKDHMSDKPGITTLEETGEVVGVTSASGQYQSMAELGFCGSTMSLGMSSEHRPGPPGGGDVERLADVRGMSCGRGHEQVVLGDRPGDAGRVALLEGVGADGRVATWPVMTTIGIESM